MKQVLHRRRKGRATHRKHKKRSSFLMSSQEMDDHFYMYSNDDLPEIEADLLEGEVKPEISRDYYL